MKDDTEYWLFADESVQKGAFFSCFYGGVLICKSSYNELREDLIREKKRQNLEGHELKWQNVKPRELPQYKAMVSLFFNAMKKEQVIMRIMYKDNRNEYARGKVKKEDRYLRLYYQFIKHSFGLSYKPEKDYRLRIFLDELPDTKEKVKTFKNYLSGLSDLEAFSTCGLKLDKSHITEVDSKNYIVMQCLDIILGAMAFRLNEMHKKKPEGARIRGKRTIAKDRLYRFIISEIIKVNEFKAFDPKPSTRFLNYPHDNWDMPYRHWSFIPKNK